MLLLRSPLCGALHRTVWVVVGLALVYIGYDALVMESYIKNDAINDLFVSKGELFLYASGAVALGSTILLLAIFFWALAWKQLRSRRGRVTYEVAG